MKRARDKPEWKIPFVYFLAGAVWILLSDVLLFEYLESVLSVQTISMVKGWFFVILTALLLSVLLRRYFAELCASEERYRLLSEDLPAMICEFLPDSTLTYVNRAYSDYFSRRPEELIGKRFLDFLPKEDAVTVQRTYMELTPDQPFRTYTHAVMVNGNLVEQEWTDRAFFNDRGNPVRFQAVGFDVTDRRRIEQALALREEQYRLLVENQTDLLVKVDTAGLFEFVSPSYCRLFGKEEEELIGSSFISLVHEDDRARTLGAMESLLHPPYQAHLEQRAMTRYGWRWLEWIDSAVRDEKGNVVSIIGVGRDITERKRAEAALRESEERYRILIERATDGILLLLRDGVIISCNHSVSRILRRQTEDIVGCRPEELSPLSQSDGSFSAARAQVLMQESTEGYHRSFEWVHLCGDGSEVVVEISLSRVDLRNEPVLLCFMRDITGRKQAEREITESRSRLRALAERLDQVREEERLHLSREIHDGLGQSLTAMTIDLSLFRRFSQKLDGEREEMMETIESMWRTLHHTIEQVRQIAWQMRPGMLNQLGLPDAIRQYVRDIAERSNLKLKESIEDLDPPLNERSSLALYRIVQEAATNTIRHANASAIVVRLEHNADGVLLEFTDDGTGIDWEAQGHRTGIGLSSMRERAELIGGAMTIRPACDARGTSISVHLPL